MVQQISPEGKQQHVCKQSRAATQPRNLFIELQFKWDVGTLTSQNFIKFLNQLPNTMQSLIRKWQIAWTVSSITSLEFQILN